MGKLRPDRRSMLCLLLLYNLTVIIILVATTVVDMIDETTDPGTTSDLDTRGKGCDGYMITCAIKMCDSRRIDATVPCSKGVHIQQVYAPSSMGEAALGGLLADRKLSSLPAPMPNQPSKNPFFLPRLLGLPFLCAGEMEAFLAGLAS